MKMLNYGLILVTIDAFELVAVVVAIVVATAHMIQHVDAVMILVVNIVCGGAPTAMVVTGASSTAICTTASASTAASTTLDIC